MASSTDLATLKQDSFHVAKFMRTSFEEVRASKSAGGSYTPDVTENTPTADTQTADEKSEHDAKAPGDPAGPLGPEGLSGKETGTDAVCMPACRGTRRHDGRPSH